MTTQTQSQTTHSPSLGCCGAAGTPFIQTLFMGASVAQFSGSIAWNNTDGGLTVEVAEDKCAGHVRVYANGAAGLASTTAADQFRPPEVGSPCLFYYGGFLMGGILKTWTQVDSADGAKVYNVQLGSPAEILAGVQVILSAYDGPTYVVPNLLNVHGFIESLCPYCADNGFAFIYPPFGIENTLDYPPAPGWCKQSGAGWTWSQIYSALSIMLASGAVSFRGYRYNVDISELGVLFSGGVSDELRIGGESKSVLDIVDEICKIAGVEYFFDLIPNGPAGSCAGNLSKSSTHYIKLRVGKSPIQALDQSAADVDAALCTDPDARLGLGTIGSFIQGASCVNKQTHGLELCMNVVNAFITGEFRKDIWQVDYMGSGDGWSDTIWPYWGKDPVTGAVIIGQGYNDPYDSYNYQTSHRFTVNTSLIDPSIPLWTISIPELRAALVGESNWRAYLFNLERPKFNLLFRGFTEWDLARPIGERIPDMPNQIRQKIIDLAAAFPNPDKVAPDDPKLKMADVGAFGRKLMQDTINRDAQDHIRASKFFDYVRKFATDYYGKKFMVKLPFICTSYDPDAPWSWGHNWQETDAGWAEGPVLGLSPLGGLSAWILELFRVEDGRLRGFCRYFFDNGVDSPGPSNPGKAGATSHHGLILDKVNKNDCFIVSENEAYVGCTADTSIPEGPIVGISPTDWRIVINVSGPVSAAPRLLVPEEWQLLHAIMNKAMNKVEKDPAELNFKKFANFVFNAGSDKSAVAGTNAFIAPISVAVPLQSKKIVYGPWWANNNGTFFGSDNGTTQYERESNMAPWTFGSKYLMDWAGQTTAGAYVHDKYVIERGDITFPGAPMGSLGQMLVMGGPVVTRIDVNVGRGDGAVTTSIGMKTWQPNFGEFARRRVAAVQRAAGIAMKAERMFKKHSLEIIKTRIDNSWAAQWTLNWQKMVGLVGHSSHDFLFGNTFKDPMNEEWGRGSVVSSEGRKDYAMLNIGTKCNWQSNEDWRRRAYMEQIGMFRPFSTLYKEVVEDMDDGRFLSRYETLHDGSGDPIPPPQGEDNYKLNTVGESDEGKACNFPLNNTYWYSNEQLPPIYCYEHHKPITVNTLSPFLAREEMIVPGQGILTCDPDIPIEILEDGWIHEPSVRLTQTPSGVGHDIEYIARDGVYPTHLSVREDDYSPVHWYRAVALRGPLIIAGWGYDIDNHPVPNACEKDWKEWTKDEGPQRLFEKDWLRKPHKWKCGPVDLRWDYRRKVWTAPPAMKIVRAVLKDWLGIDNCAGAIIFDDMMQWDELGKAVKVKSECGKTGYEVTIFNSYNSCNFPKGVVVTAYYDTTKQRYEVIFGPNQGLLEAILDEDLYCDNEAWATIIGAAGGALPGPCDPYAGKKIRLSNFLRQPICAGRKLFVWITQCVFKSGPPENPTLGDCNKACQELNYFKGVIVQAEFHPECFITRVELVETMYWGKIEDTKQYTATFTPAGTVTATGTLYGWASGTIGVPSGLCTDSGTASVLGRAMGSLTGTFTGSGSSTFTGTATGNVSVTGGGSGGSFSSTGTINIPISVTGTGTFTGSTSTGTTSKIITIPEASGTVSVSGNISVNGNANLSVTGTSAGTGTISLPHSHTITGNGTTTSTTINGTFTGQGMIPQLPLTTVATQGTFSGSGTASGNICVTGVLPNYGCTVSGTATGTMPHTHPVSLTGSVSGLTFSGTGTIPSATGSVTLPSYEGNISGLTASFTGTGTVNCGGGSVTTNTSPPNINWSPGTLPSVTFPSCNGSCTCGGSGVSGCSCSCSCTSTGGSFNPGSLPSLTYTEHSHTIPCGSICGCISSVSVTGSGTVSSGSVTSNPTGPATCSIPSQSVTVNGNVTGTSLTMSGTTGAASNDVVSIDLSSASVSCTPSGNLTACGSGNFNVSVSGVTEIPVLNGLTTAQLINVNGVLTGTADPMTVTLTGTTNTATPSGTVAVSGVLSGTAAGNVSASGINTLNGSFTLPSSTIPIDLGIPSLEVECTGSMTMTGSSSGEVTISGNIPNLTITSSGSVSLDVEVSGTVPVEGIATVSGCLPVQAVATIPSYRVTGRIDDVVLQTDTDISPACFTFHGTECTFTMDVEYNATWKYYRYEICACWRQLFIESEVGKILCSRGGSPCTCPQDCDPAALCKTFIQWVPPCPPMCSCSTEPPEPYCQIEKSGGAMPETFTLNMSCSGAVNNCSGTTKPPYNITAPPACNPTPPVVSPISC